MAIHSPKYTTVIFSSFLRMQKVAGTLRVKKKGTH
uniref:Uncharacterized protein n=1 Tax=Arundo donax TaxID=35708 RepID=A0A0A9BHE0_ARUDO